MTEALLLIGLVNGGLWLLLWVMAGLEPPHPHPEPALPTPVHEDLAGPSRQADRPERHLSLTA